MKNFLTFKTSCFFVFFSTCILQLNGQTVDYGYNSSGNRITRSISLKSANPIDSLENESKQEYEETFGDIKISIYPNPVKDILNFTIKNLPSSTNVTVSIYTIEGKTICSENVQAQGFLDISGLTTGMYFLRIQFNNEDKIWQIIKE